MNLEAFSVFSDTNEWAAIWLEMALGGLALALLLLELVLGRRAQQLIPWIALGAQAVLLVLLAVFFGAYAAWEHQPIFSGMLAVDFGGQVMRAFLLVTSLLATYLGIVFFRKQQLPRVEFFHVLLVVAAAMMLLARSAHFVMLFVALEAVTVGFYVLVSYCRTNPASLEAGLKYLVLGGVSSAILLFGIVLLYGAAGAPQAEAIEAARAAGVAYAQPDPIQFANLREFILVHADSLLVNAGVLLVLAGIAFKVAAFPFQIWVPDVYQGAPTPVTAFLAVGSKAAGFFVLMNLLHPETGPFAPLAAQSAYLVPFLVAITAVTILFGNVTALPQRNVKRVMGLSGVAHAGYLLMGVVAMVEGADLVLAEGAIFFYLVTYLLGSFAVFGVMAQVAGTQDDFQELEHYANFARKEPFLAGVLSVGLGSLAGIPPLAGFIGKLLLFIVALKAELYLLLGLALIGVVISIYYYFGWIREAFFLFRGITEPEGTEGTAASPSSEVRPPLGVGLFDKFALGLLAVLTVVVGVYQGFFTDLW